MANDSVGTVSVDIVGNQEPLKKSIEGLSSSLQKPLAKLGAAITAAFSAAAVIKFGKDSVEAAAAVNAANSQMLQTFGELEDAARSAMNSVAKESGIVETRLQNVGTSIYAFAKAAGMDSVSALNMMQEALQITADSAAYYDRSLEDTAESLKSFLKGNYANDAALGLSCTETTRNAAANKLYGKSFMDLSEAQKQLTLLQMVKDANALSGAMGQAAREADGWENVTGNLKEAWKQFLAVVGQPVLKIATSAVKQLTAALEQLTAYATSAINALGELFGWDTSELQSSVNNTSDSISIIAGNAEESTDNISDTTKAAQKLKKALAGFDQLNILSASEDDISENGSESGNSIATTVTPEIDASSVEKSFEKSLDGMTSKLQSLLKDCGFDDFLSKLQQGVSEVDFTSITDNFNAAAESLQPIAKAAVKGTKKVFKSSMKLMGSVAGGTVKVVGKSVQTVSGGIAKWLGKDKEKIAGYIDTVSANIASGLDNVSLFVDTVTTTAGESIDRMRPTMENAIANMLSGITTFAGSMNVIFSGAFNIATGVIAQWATDNEGKIGTFFDNIQGIGADCMNAIGTVFQDVGDTMIDWWENGGAELWENICKAFTDVQTIFIDVFNNYVMPIWDSVKKAFESAWKDCLSPIFGKLIAVITKLWNEIIYPLWENLLKPLCDWIIKVLGPVFKTVFNVIGEVCKDCFSVIGGVIGGILDALGGLIDFISGVFTGDWEKAWKGISDFFKGIWDGIWSIIKFIINLIIDGINMLWSGIYYAVKGIVDSIGGISGALGSLFGQDWSFSMPAEPPLIPKLAKGGLVKAPTLALVGDNPNAAHDPEVVAPLSKLDGMLGQENTEIVLLLRQLLRAVNGKEEVYQNNIYLDSDVIERRLVKVRRTKNRRYGGAVT